jgi:hypothetical protein
MAQARVLQGTWQELAVHAAALGDKQLTLVIPGDENGERELLSRRPEVVKTEERLVEMLLHGLASPGRELTDADWDERIAEAERRAEDRLR